MRGYGFRVRMFQPFIFGFMVLFPLATGNASDPSIEKTTRQLELQETEQLLQSGADERSRLQGEIEILRNDRARLNQRLIETTDRIRATELRIRSVEDRLATLSESEAKARASLEMRQAVATDILAALQRVLEGKPFLLKKKNELVSPAPGFTVFATANTKGKGSEDGRYMFTNVLNEAFLERFPNTMEQDWPPAAVETKIIRKELKTAGRTDDDFGKKLVQWATVIRKTFADGGCDEVISTRRLVHIVKTFGIFGDKTKAIKYCLNRFDADTSATFFDLYTKVDAGIDPLVKPEPASETSTVSVDEQPF